MDVSTQHSTNDPASSLAHSVSRYNFRSSTNHNLLSRVAKRSTADRGRGLFAQQPIAAGEIVLCEKALCCVTNDEREGFTVYKVNFGTKRFREAPLGGASNVLIAKLTQHPSLVPVVLDLHSGQSPAKPDTESTTDGLEARLRRIYDANSFRTGIPAQEGTQRAFAFSREAVSNNILLSGLWVQAAYTNHSCVPNAEPSFFGDVMVIRAVRPIAQDEEVTISYGWHGEEYSERQAIYSRTWGFKCRYQLCVADSRSSTTTRLERLQLRNRLGGNAAPDVVGVTKSLIRQLLVTYDLVGYRGLPRNELSQAYYQLYTAHRLSGEAVLAEAALFKFLKEQQILLSINDNEVGVQIGSCSLCSEVVMALRWIAERRRVKGDEAIAEQILRTAKQLYTTLNGCIVGFDMIEAQEA